MEDELPCISMYFTLIITLPGWLITENKTEDKPEDTKEGEAKPEVG
jgi:hypothetical protein